MGRSDDIQQNGAGHLRGGGYKASCYLVLSPLLIWAHTSERVRHARIDGCLEGRLRLKENYRGVNWAQFGIV